MDNEEKYLLTYITHNEDNTNMELHIYGLYSTEENAKASFRCLVTTLLNEKNKRYSEEKELFSNSIGTINRLLDRISHSISNPELIESLKCRVNDIPFRPNIENEYTKDERNDIISDMHIQITKLTEDISENFILCKNY